MVTRLTAGPCGTGEGPFGCRAVCHLGLALQDFDPGWARLRSAGMQGTQLWHSLVRTEHAPASLLPLPIIACPCVSASSALRRTCPLRGMRGLTALDAALALRSLVRTLHAAASPFAVPLVMCPPPCGVAKRPVK